MKDTLTPVIIFCIVLVIIAVLSAFFFIVYLIGSKLYMYPSVSWEMIVTLVPAALTTVLLPTVLLSLFFALIRARRQPGLVFFTYLVLGGLAFAVLFLAPQFITTSLSAAIGNIQAKSTVALRDLEEPGKLVALKNAFLYFESRENGTLRSGAYMETTGPAPRLSAFDRAELVRRGEETTLALPAPPRIITLRPRAEETAPFTPEPETGSVFDFVGGFNQRYLDAGRRPAEFLLVCVLFVSVILSASFFLRVTRWPLANIFITLLILSGILTLYNFVSQKFADELPKLFGPSPVFTLIPNGILVFFSALFFLLDFVFLREKRKEPTGA